MERRAGGSAGLRSLGPAALVVAALLLTSCGPQAEEAGGSTAPRPAAASPSTPEPEPSSDAVEACRALNDYYETFLTLALATSGSLWGGDASSETPRATVERLGAHVEQSLQALRDPTFVPPDEIAADLDRTLAVTADALEVLARNDHGVDLDQWFSESTTDADERAAERVFEYIETHCQPNSPFAPSSDADAFEPPPVATETPAALPPPPDRHATVRLPDGREFAIGVGAGDDTGGWVAAFLNESMTILDPTDEEIPGALDYHGSGYIDIKAFLFTPLAQLRDGLPDWSFELFDVDDDLVAEHLAVTDPDTGAGWCIDIPGAAVGEFVHHTGMCDVPSDLAPVGPPRPATSDGP